METAKVGGNWLYLFDRRLFVIAIVACDGMQSTN
jgi:hypothetical protein